MMSSQNRKLVKLFVEEKISLPKKSFKEKIRIFVGRMGNVIAFKMFWIKRDARDFMDIITGKY